MDDFKLSPHFSYFELTNTTHREYLDSNRDVPQSLLMNGYALAAVMLEPIRMHYNKPLIVHSAYRCPGLNKAIGGSSTSQHMSFQAADFHVNAEGLEDTFKWIWKCSGMRWGQLILEGWSVGKPSWIHISLPDPWWDGKPMQVLTFEAGKYTRLQ